MPILLIGPLNFGVPTGLSLAFNSLVKGFQESHRPYRLVDLSERGRPHKPGKMSIRRIAQVAPLLIPILKNMLECSGVYLTISDSKSGFLRDFLTIWCAKLFRKKIVLHLHSGGYSEFYHTIPSIHQKIVRVTLSQASAIITLSDRIKEQFTFLPNYECLVVVIHNGLPIDIPNKQFKLPSFPRFPEDTFNVLYLSNMIRSKGYLDVLDAAAEIVKRGYKDIRFHFCGEFLDETTVSAETNRKNFIQYINEPSIKPFITYHGVVRGEKKNAILSDSHILVLPTFYPTEGQPLCIIEGLANGIPVVATSWRGITDLVVNNETGYLIDPKCPECIADKILALRNDAVRYKKMSIKAQRCYFSKFSRNIHLEKMFELFDSIFADYDS